MLKRLGRAVLIVALSTLGASLPAHAQPEVASSSAAIHEKLLGSWVVDLDTLAEFPGLKELSGEAKEQAVAAAKEMLKTLSFDFAKDGRLVVTIGAEKQEGTFRVSAAKGNEATVIVKMGDNDEESTTVLFEGERLKMTDASGTPVILKRK